MSKQLGAFAPDDELERPDLNKCPDCGCYFATDDCPLCGKPCPPEMMAGVRVEVKPKKKKRQNSSGRVQFIPWFHQWWVILIAMFVFPVAGIILMATSPYAKKWKILIITGMVIVFVLEYTGLGNIVLNAILSDTVSPVNAKLSREAYEETCEPVSATDFFHMTAGEGYYRMDLVVNGSVNLQSQTEYSYDGDTYNPITVYLCYAPADPSSYVFVYDYQCSNPIALKAGDCITVWGQTNGTAPLSVEMADGMVTAPRLYAAYFQLRYE